MDEVTFDPDSSLRLIAESLGLVDQLGARPIRVLDVRMVDRTLVIEVTVASTDSMAVRSEIAGVMGALSGLDVPSLFPVLDVQYFGVRAFATTGQEAMWIVSSPDVATLAAQGQPVEWLAQSLVQENTPGYRRSQADRTVGQIETALRDLIDHHGSELVGQGYAEQLWAESAVREMRDRARAEQPWDNDTRSLLDYAYLPQLRGAIVNRIEWFRDCCVPEVSVFEGAMTLLNRVRRKVAHHRAITDEDLRSCREAAQKVLGPVGRRHPDFAVDFLVDRWEEQVEQIIGTTQQDVQRPDVPDHGTVSEVRRRRAAVTALETQLAALDAAVSALNRLVVPAQRSELHGVTTDALTQWRDALQKMTTVARQPDLMPSKAEAAHQSYQAALRRVREVSREITRIRVASPPTLGSPRS